jgi:acyl carrier protein
MGVTLVGEIGRVLGQRFSLAALVNAPTVHQFAAFITSQQRAREGDGMDVAAIARQIRGYLVQNHLSGDGHSFSNHESLLQREVMDETSVLDLVSYLEEAFGITVADHELNSTNLESIDTIAAFVRRKMDRSSAPAAQLRIASAR